MDPGEKFIQDLIKGAMQTEGFMPGGVVGVQRDVMRREEKLAGMGGGIAGGLGGLLGPGAGTLAAGLGAGLQDGNVRSGVGAGLGSMLGGVGGSALGLIDPRLSMLSPILSGVGGAVGQSLARPKESALKTAFVAGRDAALARYKVAFLGAVAPLLGSVAGPALARAGLGKVAPALASGLGNGMKGMAFDTAASMAGGAMGNKLTGQQQ